MGKSWLANSLCHGFDASDLLSLVTDLAVRSEADVDNLAPSNGTVEVSPPDEDACALSSTSFEDFALCEHDQTYYHKSLFLSRLYSNYFIILAYIKGKASFL